jgi:hypothetical protein
MTSIFAASTASQASLSAATIGNTLEWYDFLIYGFLAITVARLFFPAENELTSLLFSVGTFGAAAVVRPVAGVVLGIYADWVGRKADLTLTIFLDGFGHWTDRTRARLRIDWDLGPGADGERTPAEGLCLRRGVGRSNGDIACAYKSPESDDTDSRIRGALMTT